MKRIAIVSFVLAGLTINTGKTATVGYAFTITTAYHAGDPFGNRLDSAFVEPYGTGYFRVQNTGTTTFSGQIGDLAISADAGNLSFTSNLLTLIPGQAVSVAIPDNSADVGGFNGPAYFYRPGVEIEVDGFVTDGTSNEPIALTVADAYIQSGIDRTDPYGLTSDSFVLQGGDPWGFANPTTWALTLADGVYVASETVPEPSGLGVFSVGLCAVAAWAGFRPARDPVRSRWGSP